MLDIKQLKKSYIVGGKSMMILKGIDLQVKKGEFIAIMGPSGSGKTTLMNMIGLLDTPTSGEYFFENTNTIELSEDEQADFRREKIGFVFQSYNLLPRIEARQQVALPLFYRGRTHEKRYEKAVEMLGSLGMKDKINHTPDMLSGGEQQRTCIARALICNPDLILADEPTGALDSKTGAELLDIFHTINAQGITILLVTHDKKVASHAHKIITIKDGLIHKNKK